MNTEVKKESESFSERDYGWREEVKKRSNPDYELPNKVPFGNSPLLKPICEMRGSLRPGATEPIGDTVKRFTVFDHIASEMVLGHEGWDDAIGTFEVRSGNKDLEDHGGEFDMMARRRMIKGGRWLLPMIFTNLGNQEGSALELGPFTDPLLTPGYLDKLDITYLDNEPEVLEVLKRRFKSTRGVRGNFAQLDSIEELQGQEFDFMIMSQMFNYVDFRKLLEMAKAKLRQNGLVLINNVAHYGIPEYFAEEGKRPNSEWDTLQALEDLGFEIQEWIVVPSLTDREAQPLDRLLAVAKKI